AAHPANVVVGVGRQGLLGAYRKVHLYDAFGQRESDRLEPGDAGAPPLVVDVDGVRVGVMTCYDLRFPESARRLVDAGATALAVPAAWAAGQEKVKHWRVLLRARAIENTVYVLGAAMQGRGVSGAPMVVDPWGVVLADPGTQGVERTPDGGTGVTVAVADLEPEHVERVRLRNPSLANRRYDVVPRA
ncbi:MAG TPA: nitrilase-related carbon-nitrogen hydrolase, partial [Actinotalea sp.]|nr:nitrilase-related carbon-nitrogen hydrolase [Actinotalea sp.]